MRKSAEARFWERVDTSGDCWIWLGSTSTSRGSVDGGRLPPSKPYGQLTVNGRTRRAHRYAYEIQVGPIPDGMTINHKCHETLCVKGEHLEPMSSLDNGLEANTPFARRAVSATCDNGHPKTEENSFRVIRSTGRVERRCKECRDTYQARRRAS